MADNAFPADGPDRVAWDYLAGDEENALPWGPHEAPTAIRLGKIEISLAPQGSGLLYRREGAAGEVEKLVLAEQASLLLNPVEPLHCPVEVSSHLMICFARPVLVEPQSSRKIAVTFPLEIAVLIGGDKRERQVVDVFCTGRPKYTLYGRVTEGLVCRYWQGTPSGEPPATNPLEEGVMELEIGNATPAWAEVNRAVFSAHGMRMHYGPRGVFMYATMKILGELSAETSFVSSSNSSGQKLLAGHFVSSLVGVPGKTLMEEGY